MCTCSSAQRMHVCFPSKFIIPTCTETNWVNDHKHLFNLRRLLLILHCSQKFSFIFQLLWFMKIDEIKNSASNFNLQLLLMSMDNPAYIAGITNSCRICDFKGLQLEEFISGFGHMLIVAAQICI